MSARLGWTTSSLEVLLQARVLQGRRLVRLSAGSEVLSRDLKGYSRVNTDMDVHNSKEHLPHGECRGLDRTLPAPWPDLDAIPAVTLNAPEETRQRFLDQYSGGRV